MFIYIPKCEDKDELQILMIYEKSYSHIKNDIFSSYFPYSYTTIIQHSIH